MPSYCRNIVIAPKKILDEIYDGKKVTFNKLIPMPKTLNLIESDRKDEAVLYSLLCKDMDTMQKLIILLKNTKEPCYTSYWEKLQEKYSLEMIEVLGEKAKTFMPESEELELKIKTFEELGNVYLNNLLQFDSMTWYDWSIENWGTKWDAVDSKGKPENGKLEFLTAWSEPIPIIKKLFKKYPKMRIEWQYELEGQEESGRYISDGKGKIIKEEDEIAKTEEI